ncbi:MAG: DUF1353 domain-containing protein, partial [Lamprobacter sp.]|uniref:DUF1353 domain-containing protein n=1 Tax=Lamprobacter sp. TaxID=3100796 RepID=UPI002B25DFDD
MDHRTSRRPHRLRRHPAPHDLPSLAPAATVGRTGKAAVIHDWLCDEQPHSVDHKMAADIFNEAMAVLGEPRWSRAIMVWAVKSMADWRLYRAFCA